jgi:Ammonium Transporter Family
MAVPFLLGNGTLLNRDGAGISHRCSAYLGAVSVTHEYTSGDIAWVITASAMVWLMLPGVGFFYSGLTGQKSALSMIMLSFIAMSVGAIQVRFGPMRS